MSLTKEQVLQIIRKHLIRQMPRDIEIQDGIPEDSNIYGLSKDEPVWTAWIPSEQKRKRTTLANCGRKRAMERAFFSWLRKGIRRVRT